MTTSGITHLPGSGRLQMHCCMALSARLLLLNEHIQIKEPEPMDEMFGGKENARSHHLRVVRGGLAEVSMDTGMVGLQHGSSLSVTLLGLEAAWDHQIPANCSHLSAVITCIQPWLGNDRARCGRSTWLLPSAPPLAGPDPPGSGWLLMSAWSCRAI